LSYRGLGLDCLQVYESEIFTDNLAPRVVELLESGRAGLVTDIDGTISPIEALPEQARVLPRAIEALDALKRHLAVVAVVSGRTALEAQRMVGINGLTYVGNHGLEVLTSEGPHIVAEARPWLPRLARVLERVQADVALTGLIVENKGATGSVHYRLTDEPDAARRMILEVLAREAVTSGLRIEEGRMVINLLPPLTVTKGSAVTWIAREHRLHRLVYFGDDVTDAHAFKALTVLREKDELLTLSVAVVGRETPPSVRQLADATLPSVDAVADTLCDVADALETRSRTSATMGAKVPIVLGHTQDDRRSTTHGQRRAGN
jgi:trehalose 6-phosphate phosphatase